MKSCPLFSDDRFPDYSKVELVFSETPEKIQGEHREQKICLIWKEIILKCVFKFFPLFYSTSHVKKSEILLFHENVVVIGLVWKS